MCVTRWVAVVGLLVCGFAKATAAQTPPATRETSCQFTAKTREIIKYGPIWRAWDDNERNAYLGGFVDGQNDTYTVFESLPELVSTSAARKEALRLQLYTLYDHDVLRPVMTDLYRDPANIFITFGAMVYIARDKVTGRDIEPMLRYSRENDCAFAKAR
jgi:hypothetical protein